MVKTEIFFEKTVINNNYNKLLVMFDYEKKK